MNRGAGLEQGPGVLHVVVGLPHFLASSRVIVDLHLGQAVVGHLLRQVLVQLLLGDEVALLVRGKG